MMTTMLLGTARMFISAFLGTLGFALLLHAPRRAWLPASVIGAMAYALYWVLEQAGLGMPASIFIGALAGSMLAQGCARKMRMIATIFITLSIVAMVPGLGLYRCIALLAQGENAAGVRTGVQAMTTIVMIALGLGVGSFLFRAVIGMRHSVRRPADQEGR